MPSFSDTSGTTPNSGDLEQQLLQSSSNCHQQQQQQQQHNRVTGFPTIRGYQQHQPDGNDHAMPPTSSDLHPSTSSGPRSTDSSAPESPAGPVGSADDMMAIGGQTLHGYDHQVIGGGGNGGYHGNGHPTMIPAASLQLYSQLYHASAAGNMTRHHHHHHHYHQPGLDGDDEHSLVTAAQRPAQQVVATADHSAVWRPY